jgi:hypothetical protein
MIGGLAAVSDVPENLHEFPGRDDDKQHQDDQPAELDCGRYPIHASASWPLKSPV